MSHGFDRKESKDRRARRIRLHRVGMRAPAAAPSAGRDRAADGGSPGRAGDARRISASAFVWAAVLLTLGDGVAEAIAWIWG